MWFCCSSNSYSDMRRDCSRQAIVLRYSKSLSKSYPKIAETLGGERALNVMRSALWSQPWRWEAKAPFHCRPLLEDPHLHPSLCWDPGSLPAASLSSRLLPVAREAKRGCIPGERDIIKGKRTSMGIKETEWRVKGIGPGREPKTLA